MNIHIVHLPHTFSYLVDLSIAFKKYGFETITLVANGFNQNQIHELRKSTYNKDYIKILDVPTKRILSHGQALNFAFERSKDDLFCFADHDIFPTQPITNNIESALKNFEVVCFGDRPENRNEKYMGFAASATATQSGTPLATSFFSIYRRTSLELIRNSYNVGFEQYFRKSQLPDFFLKDPDIQSLKEPFLVDTCKAMSLALFQSGYKIAHLGAENVCHLGGLCGAISRFINSDKQIKHKFSIENIPSSNELECFYQANQQRHPKVLEVKRAISDYALQLLISLKNGTKEPQFYSEDENLQSSINHIYNDTKNIFQIEN